MSAQVQIADSNGVYSRSQAMPSDPPGTCPAYRCSLLDVVLLAAAMRRVLAGATIPTAR